MKDNKTVFKLWEVIVITLISSLIMSLSTGYLIYSRNYGTRGNGESKGVNELVSSYNNIISNYYDNIDETALVDAAINGMLKYLGDPYTTYLNENSTNILNNSLKGTYEGIGVEVKNNENNEIVIEKVLADSPALQAGLIVKDIIVKINDIDLSDKNASDAVEVIKESTNPDIKIMIKRNDEIKEFVVKRSSVYYPVIYSEVFNQNEKRIGYLAISQFSDTVYEQFNRELKEIEKSNIDGLIIDVRNNTGGYLSGTSSIVELFLEKGKIIYSLESKTKKEVTKDLTDEHRTYPIAVLINKGSASASEILAAALKYSYNAILVGSKSFGKGKVQRTNELSDGTMYKYTSARWLTPIDSCIDNLGIEPDFWLELKTDYAENPTYENDNQLQKALLELTK